MAQDARAGRYVMQLEGYRAFIPSRLPPSPPLKLHSSDMQMLLADANVALGRLDGATSILPNPDMFVAMYVRQEAVLSSQIEGTQSTLEDVLEFELSGAKRGAPKDVQEVVNYVKAMKYGLARIATLPVSLRLIREIHAKLLEGTRGGRREPGEFRRSQNWIGPAGVTLANATFVPPPVHEMNSALDNLEEFLHDRGSFVPLIHCGLAHAQFETIHPFLDGNGRVGRLLITFLLCCRGVLSKPLLYLSHYFKAHRDEYYARLMAIREKGDWEGWLAFFLKAVHEVSIEANETAKAIINMREKHRKLISATVSSSGYAVELLDYLFEQPVVDVGTVERRIGHTYATANTLVEGLVHAGILTQITKGRRYRLFRYEPYLALFADRGGPTSAPAGTTEGAQT